MRPTVSATLRSRVPASLAGAAALMIALSACGGGEDSGSSMPTDGPAGTPTSAPTGTAAPAPGEGPRDPGGDVGGRFQEIRECLEAAGIPLPTFSRPTGSWSGRPTGNWSGRPTGRPSGAPRDMPGGQGGPMGGMLDSPEVAQALAACGISVPTPSPRPTDQSTPNADGA